MAESKINIDRKRENYKSGKKKIIKKVKSGKKRKERYDYKTGKRKGL